MQVEFSGVDVNHVAATAGENFRIRVSHPDVIFQSILRPHNPSTSFARVAGFILSVSEFFGGARNSLKLITRYFKFISYGTWYTLKNKVTLLKSEYTFHLIFYIK